MGWFAILSRVVSDGLSEVVAYEQRCEVRVGVSHVDLWGRAFPVEEVEQGGIGGPSGIQWGWSSVTKGRIRSGERVTGGQMMWKLGATIRTLAVI